MPVRARVGGSIQDLGEQRLRAESLEEMLRELSGEEAWAVFQQTKELDFAYGIDTGILLIGEMRDVETIRLALNCASMGMLVFGTLHTNNAPMTIDRVIDAFPADEQNQIRTMDVSLERLLKHKQISAEEAYMKASNKEVFEKYMLAQAADGGSYPHGHEV